LAELKQSVIGKLSGKLGNVVFRQLNGKTFISVRPVKYKPTKSELAANVRSGFVQINLFASTINKDPILKSIWQVTKINARSAYTKILKANLEISPKTGVNKNNIIVPKNNIFLKSDLIYNKNILKISYDQNSINKNLGLFTELNCFILLFYSEPIHSKLDPFNVVLLNSNNYSIGVNKIVFSLKNIKNQYFKKALIFHTLLSTTEDKVINWSSTISNEVVF
jgi:hypothetical protein